MSNNPLFPQSYPGPGQFVILCEGDAIGYEAAILGRWLRNEPPASFLVDVRPCGTGDGLFGTADAIGRTVRVVVVEDRDFRTTEVAQKHCAKQLADRNSRNLAMRGWLSWTRNEVENFFLDGGVLFPAMKEAFGCEESDVKRSLDMAVKSLVLFQSVQAAVAATGAAWETLNKQQYTGGGKPK